MFTGTTRFTSSTGHAGALVTATLVLAGASILCAGAARANSNQDDQFLALLDSEGIPALEGVPNLIDTAHKICRALDAGFSADTVVDAMVQNAYEQDPAERDYAPGRLARTEAKFITAAVGAYCPYDRGKLASITANPAADWKAPPHQGAVFAHDAVNSAAGRFSGEPAYRTVPGSRIDVVPAGDIAQPKPPEIPAPPPIAHLRTPPEPIATPPRPRQSAPRPQQPAPPPAELPAPPPELPPPPPPPPPPPAPPMSPGFVRLAP